MGRAHRRLWPRALLAGQCVIHQRGVRWYSPTLLSQPIGMNDMGHGKGTVDAHNLPRCTGLLCSVLCEHTPCITCHRGRATSLTQSQDIIPAELLTSDVLL